MNFSITHEGRTTIDTDRETAIALGYPEAKIDAAEMAALQLMQRDRVRAEISEKAGDALSLLGTTSDAATIAVLVSACFMASLDEGTGYSAFRAKANAFMQGIAGEHDPTEIAQAFLTNVASGEIRLPALEKGIVEVLAEVTARGNAVAEAINPSTPAEA